MARTGLRVALLLLAGLLFNPSCGGGGGSPGPNPATIAFGFDVAGGNVDANATNSAVGGGGGTLTLYSRGAITVDASSAPSAPSLPTPPGTGTIVTSADLTGAKCPVPVEDTTPIM